MSESRNPTPGPWVVEQDDFVIRVGSATDTLYESYLPEWEEDDFLEEQKKALANAALIAEAGNVHHDTGLSPRQLVEQRDALAKALEKISSIENKDFGSDWEEIEEARYIASAALALVKGGEK